MKISRIHYRKAEQVHYENVFSYNFSSLEFNL